MGYQKPFWIVRGLSLGHNWFGVALGIDYPTVTPATQTTKHQLTFVLFSLTVHVNNSRVIFCLFISVEYGEIQASETLDDLLAALK